jgi:hypothetical protein
MKQRWTRGRHPGWSGEDDIFLEASAAANRPIGIGGITTIQLAV